MASNIDALAICQALRDHEPHEDWRNPTPHGPDGWSFVNGPAITRSCIVSCAPYDGEEWVHASITGAHAVPAYATLVMLHRAVWGEHGWSYQVFAPLVDHVNIHSHALHLWGRLDGRRVLPDFTRGFGSI